MMGFLVAATMAMPFSFGEVKVSCAEPGDWKVACVREETEKGVEIVTVTLDAPGRRQPPKFTVEFQVPQVEMFYRWSVNDVNFALPPNWGGACVSEFARNMPLYAFLNGNDESVLALAASECTRCVDFKGGVREEGSLLEIGFRYFEKPEAPISHYETSVRIDTRRQYFGKAVSEGAAWIEKAGGYRIASAPPAAFDPLYSSWYSFHQDVFAKPLEEELEIAARLGMKTVILDDGWQTDDTGRGYAFCGDWEVSRRRFPDMAAHVKKVHDLGMKYMVWYSVPFVGLKSANYAKFKGKYLFDEVPGMGAAVLDPRFPEVRAFLVETYVKAVKAWDIDGLKLDFIDSFGLPATDPAEKENYAGRDVHSVSEAIDRLMREIRAALVAVKSDILLEFRQSYVGPGVRQVGNMLRVGDCPADMRRNRFAIANLRLVSGGTAVHSDMLEWNFAETPASAARYVINSMFGVVQYSLMLRSAPREHREMIEKWIRFSQEHRQTLLHGTFTPRHPELQYPVIEAESDEERIIGLYDDGRVLEIPDAKKTIVMNASGKDAFVIRRNGRLSEVACKSGDWIELR